MNDKHIEVLDLYRAGVSRKDIGSITGYSSGAVSRILNRNGVRVFTKTTDDEKKQIIELNKQGLTHAEISEKTGRSTSVVSRVLTSNGVRTEYRTFTESEKDLVLRDDLSFDEIAETLKVPRYRIGPIRYAVKKERGLPTKPKRKYSDDDVALLCSDKPLADISEELGIAISTVIYQRRRLRKEGQKVKSVRVELTPEQEHLLMADKPIKEIAVEVGMTHKQVIARRFQIRQRNGGECNVHRTPLSLEEQLKHVKPLW